MRELTLLEREGSCQARCHGRKRHVSTGRDAYVSSWRKTTGFRARHDATAVRAGHGATAVSDMAGTDA